MGYEENIHKFPTKMNNVFIGISPPQNLDCQWSFLGEGEDIGPKPKNSKIEYTPEI